MNNDRVLKGKEIMELLLEQMKRCLEAAGASRATIAAANFSIDVARAEDQARQDVFCAARGSRLIV